MKKIIIALIFICVPVVSLAQVPVQTTQVGVMSPEVKEQYVSLLKQMIALLQMQLEILIAQEIQAVALPTVPLQALPIYNTPMTTPETPKDLPVASAPEALPNLLAPRMDLTSSPTIQKGQSRIVFVLEVSNIDETILVDRALVTFTSDYEDWTPRFSISYKGKNIPSDSPTFVKGQNYPLFIYLESVPDKVGNITLNLGQWMFAGQTSGNIVPAMGVPTSITIPVQE